jgi:endonuclease/exonuclease/phosphatase family metal-dependent hydrolase
MRARTTLERNTPTPPRIGLAARRAGSIWVVLVCAAVVSVSAVPVHAASARVGFLQFNVCGKTCHLGTAVVGDIENVVASSSPQPFVLTLNEMCRSDYARLTSDLPTYHGYFQTTLPGNCADGSDNGDVVLARTTGISYLGSWALPRPGGGEPRRLTCLRTSVAGASRPLVACVTHIDYHASNTASQIAAVAARAEGYLPANAVLVGGDFNSIPTSSALNVIYTPSYPNGRGSFVEADSANQSRTGGGSSSTYNEFTGCGGAPCPSASHPAHRKIDYVFMSGSGFSTYSANALSAAHSDHRPLLATAVVN